VDSRDVATLIPWHRTMQMTVARERLLVRTASLSPPLAGEMNEGAKRRCRPKASDMQTGKTRKEQVLETVTNPMFVMTTMVAHLRLRRALMISR